MNLNEFFSEKYVIKLESTEKQLVIRELVTRLEELGDIENKDRYYAQIVHRESLENTGIGNGFAIPHARTESVNRMITILGISESGIDYQSYDNQPVHYVLLNIFPSDMSTKYLYLIAMMARIFSDPAKKSALDLGRTDGSMYQRMNSEVLQYFETISEKKEQLIPQDENLSHVPSSNLDLLIRLDRLYDIHDRGENSPSIIEKINEIRKLIDNRSLTYYERMRKKHSKPFALMEKTSCAGCHMEIPPIYIQKIQKQEGINLCPNCGRFLIVL